MSTQITDPVLLNLERKKTQALADLVRLERTKVEAFTEQNQTITRLRTKREELEKEVEELAHKRDRLLQQLSDTGSSMTDYKQSALQELDKELESKREKTNELHQRLSEESAHLASEISLYEKKLEELEQSRIILEARAKRLEEREKNVKRHDEELSSLVSTASNAVKTAENRKAELDQLIETLSNKVSVMKVDLELYDKEYKRRSKELKEWEIKMTLKEREIADTMELHTQKETELQNREALLKDREETLQRALKEYKQKGILNG